MKSRSRGFDELFEPGLREALKDEWRITDEFMDGRTISYDYIAALKYHYAEPVEFEIVPPKLLPPGKPEP